MGTTKFGLMVICGCIVFQFANEIVNITFLCFSVFFSVYWIRSWLPARFQLTFLQTAEKMGKSNYILVKNSGQKPTYGIRSSGLIFVQNFVTSNSV